MCLIMKNYLASLALISLMLSNAVYADESTHDNTWSYVKDTLSKTWEANDYELYVPMHTWHNRSYYTSEKIDQYNENPWGLGIGKYRFDDDGDWHGLYAMAFADSHKKMQPVAGYGFQKMWHATDDLRLGAGYTLGFTLREDFNYMPIPIIAPLASVEYKQIALQSTYIFGGNGNGNILFTWLRWQIK